ncbi:MAG: M50 family metallopeptidase [Asticcacaulis sp.]
MIFILAIPIFLLVISLIVTIHELGHFSVARLFKTKIDRFSVGFGPIIWSKRDKNGVLWCLSALPLGGYVKFAGDEHVSSMSPDAEELEKARLSIIEQEGPGAERAYFHFKPVWQRFLIVLAGPAANFVLAIVIFAGVFMLTGKGTAPGTIMEVPNGPGERAGLKVGDQIVRIDGRAVKTSEDVVMLIRMRGAEPTRIDLIRDGQPLSLTAVPERRLISAPKDPVPTYGGFLAISIGDGQPHPVWPHEALWLGTQKTFGVLDTTVTYIGRIFSGKENGDQLSGIIGMTKATGDLTAQVVSVKASPGQIAFNLLFTMLQMAAFISVGIGFINLLPVPVLDGGHLVFYIYEAIMRRPLSAAIQGLGYRFGLMALLGLMLFATWNDLNRTGVIKFLGGLFS